MKVIPTKIKDLLLLEPLIFTDARGYFMESYNKQTLEALDIKGDFIQDNHSLSTATGTIRGLHFQQGANAQTKLVRCTAGAIYDVAVDLRSDSPTYGHWVGLILSAYNHRQLLIPKGFAHGFCTLVPDTVVAYKVDAPYCPTSDVGIIWNDPNLAIDWPITTPILSEKDQQHPTLEQANFTFTNGGEPK